MGGNVTAKQIAKELDERYYARELPHKLKFGITGCQNNCLKACRTRALTEQNGKILLDPEKCNFCGRCVKSCPTES